MKKRLMSAVIAAVVLMALFAACGDEVQTVANETAKQVGTITVTQLAKNYYVVVSWDAVEGGTGYQVYVQVEGKNNILNGYNDYNGDYQNFWGWNQVAISNETPESENIKYTPNISALDNFVLPLTVQYIEKDFEYGQVWDSDNNHWTWGIVTDADGNNVTKTEIKGQIPSGSPLWRSNSYRES